MKRTHIILFFIGVGIFLSACSKKEGEVDELSYLKLAENMNANRETELKRTQIVSVTNQGNVSTIILAFAKDQAEPPKGAAMTQRNNYALRFTLHDSFERSRTFGGGTFIFMFSSIDGKQLKVRNFQKGRDRFLTRYPAYSISNMDTILNPYIVSVANASTGECIVVGCKGVLSPTGPNKNIYMIKVQLFNAQGEIWGIDHGFPDENPKTKEPHKILNQTNLGIEVALPGHGKVASASTYNAEILGTV